MSKRKACTAATCRAARRNQVLRVEHGVWKGARASYVPAVPKGTSARRIYGKSFPNVRRPARTYKPNGLREIARRAAAVLLARAA